MLPPPCVGHALRCQAVADGLAVAGRLSAASTSVSPLPDPNQLAAAFFVPRCSDTVDDSHDLP